MSSDRQDDPDWKTVIRDAVRAGTARVRTQIPGRVLSYDAEEQRAEVQPVIRSARKDPDTGERKTYLPAPVTNAPVKFPRGKGGEVSMTWPLQRGDWVTLEFASRSLDAWLSGGGDDVEPKDPRRHDLSDVMVDPTGPAPFSDALPVEAVDDTAPVVRGDEVHLGKSEPSDWVALASLVFDEIKKVRDKLDTFISNYNVHTHTGVTTGGGTSGSPSTPESSPSSVDEVKSDTVKSE